jgi:hypothetical protein
LDPAEEPKGSKKKKKKLVVKQPSGETMKWRQLNNEL